MTSRGRRVGYVLLGAAALGGAGAFAAAGGYLRAPAPPAEPQLVTAESVCAWQSAGTSIAELVPWLSSDSEVAGKPQDLARFYTGVAITSPGDDLVLPVGVSTSFPVHLTNTRERELRLPEGSGPVLVATAQDEPAVVVGFALLDHTPAARPLAADEVVEYRDFGAFVACPGAPTVPDGVHLAAGSYRLLAGQALGLPTTTESAPFNTWGHFGELELTESASAEAFPEDPPSATPEPTLAVGACGGPAPQVVGGAAEGVAHFAVRPRELVSVDSAAPEIEVRHVNPTKVDLRTPGKGGPVILVVDSDVVVAMSRTLDPVPGGDLPAGDELVFSEFEPLVHCETGEPLPPGKYEFHVGRLLEDPAVTANRLVDFLTPAELLVVTDRDDVTREVVTWPSMPVCGESVPQTELVPESHPTSLELFDVIEEEGPGDTGGGGAGPDNSVIELAVLLDEPLVGLTDTFHIGDTFVLVRDGLVVGVQGGIYDGVDAYPLDELRGVQHTVVFDDCSSHENFTPLVLDGEYTLYGYVVYSTRHPLGIEDLILVAVGPETFTHHPPVP